MDSWGGNVVGSWGGNMVGSGGNSNSWGSLHLNSLDSWGSIMVSNWSNGKSGSWGNSLDMVSNWGSNSNNWSSMSNGVNKAILIHILRKSLQRERSIATVGCDKVTNKRGQRSRS